MGRNYTNKCLLLDERDFGIDDEMAFDDMLPRIIEDVNLHYGSADLPELEILCICSERHDRSLSADDCDAAPEWFLTNSDWEQTLVDVISKRCLVEAAFAELMLDMPGSAEALLREAIRRNADACKYLQASILADTAYWLAAGYPLGFEPRHKLERTGDDQAIDARDKRYPDGRRLIVEIAYLWD